MGRSKPQRETTRTGKVSDGREAHVAARARWARFRRPQRATVDHRLEHRDTGNLIAELRRSGDEELRRALIERFEPLVQAPAL
jgi:hypothetical protein